MIPKRAIFFWEGPEPSWLRQQSWESFGRMNPEWKVDIVDGGDCPIAKNGPLSVAHRSDLTRYRELYERGGVYFDSDIVFIRPVPDEWLDAHLILPITAELDHIIGHVALLGSVPGDSYFNLAVMQAEAMRENHKYLGYQSLGIRLLRSMKPALVGRNIKWVDQEAVLPIQWHQTLDLWNDTPFPLPELSIGVHWYGGDHLAQSLEPTIGPEWVADSTSIMADALRKGGCCEQSI